MTGQSFYRNPVEREVLTFAYLRLSDDNEGKKVSVETQWDGTVRTAGKFDVPVPPAERVFTDRNLSASDSRIVRFDYRRLIKAISAVDASRYEVVVLAYAQDRVFRQPSDWQEFSELMRDDLDGRLITEFDGTVDLSVMGVFGVGASYLEVKKTAKRTSDGIDKHAQLGKGHGPVPYGWTRIYDHTGSGKPRITTEIVEAEAQVIRNAAADLLAGKSLLSIASKLNKDGVPSPGAGKVMRRDPVTRAVLEVASGEWQPQKLRQILLRQANKGIREHTTGRGARKVTTLSKAEWEAILDDDTFDSVVEKLNDPNRRTTVSSTAKYLLSGTAMCGVCNEVCRVQHSSRGRYLAYKCAKSHVVKAMTQTDNVVVTEVLHILSQPEVRAMLSPAVDSATTDALAREAGLLARKAAAADDYSEGRIDGDTLARVTTNIGRQIDELRKTINRTRDATIYSELLATDDVETMWESYGIDRQRSIVRALFDVTIMPSTRSGRYAFDPTTIRITLKAMKGE